MTLESVPALFSYLSEAHETGQSGIRLFAGCGLAERPCRASYMTM